MKHYFTLVALAILALFMAAGLAGCSSLNYAGVASYSVQPFKAADGSQMCCTVEVHNGKEIATLDAHITKTGNDYTVDLKEQGVLAFEGQRIAGTAAQAAIDAAARAAVATALAPLLPAMLPAAGAALSSGGLPAAAVGAGTVIGVQKVMAP
jgi:hypothetical protein